MKDRTTEALGSWGGGGGGGGAQQMAKPHERAERGLQSSASLQSVGGRSTQQQPWAGGVVSTSHRDTVPGSPENGLGGSMNRRNVRIVNLMILLGAVIR